MDKLTIVGQHDDRTITQMRNCLRDERATAGVLCADGHLGYAQPVGGVIAYHDSISVSGVGFDIACGNYAVRTDVKMADLDEAFMPALAEKIARNISFGVGRRNIYHSVEHPLLEKDSHPGCDIPFVRELKGEAASQLGTVRSGNHYVDVFEAEHDGSVWVGVHFGSRGLGHKIASHYTKLAGGKNGIDVEPAVLAAESDLGREYLVAMDLAGLYAYAGREWVVHTIVRDFMHAGITDAVHNHHNYAWKEQVGGAEHYVVRKGATPLYPGQRGFVGGSMGDISVILKGKPEGMAAGLLNSTIHGSGRVMSRTQDAGKSRWVKGRKVSQGGGLVDENAWRETMRERSIILLGAGADEMPPVYRPLRSVLSAHRDTFEVETVLLPRTAGPITWAALGAALSAATGAVIYELFRSAIDVDWSKFPNLPTDSDTINVTFGPGTGGHPAMELATLTVGLTIADGVDWWKAAELYNADGALLGSAWAQRDQGVVSNSTTVRMADLAGGFLVLKKAKMFGTHVNVRFALGTACSARKSNNQFRLEQRLRK